MSDIAVIAAAATICISAIATAWAEKELGTSAIGAMAEKESLFAKGLIITVIPETIIIFGLVVALQIIGMAGGA
ncbi:MAG: V-type ATP synthase subunit K [Candidatus Aenigmarchaeota archaeon]|nr:V-type ATP synthase subunit K [Candidatus Aenigmarchaeota archaeon]MCX6817795.1 V-type ATP synthase subunit K [Candidatus Aenigmarchaeota archaeon]